MGLCNIGGKDGYLRKMIADKLVALGVTAAKAYDSASKFVENIQTAVTNANTAGYNSGVSATKQGTASEGQVLDGYTFTNQTGLHNGSMPDRGALNWNPSTNTTYTVNAGYYSGGTLNSANAYNAGKAEANNIVAGNIVYNQTLSFPASGSHAGTIAYTATQKCIAFVANTHAEGGYSSVTNNGCTSLGNGVYLMNSGNSLTVYATDNSDAYASAYGRLVVIKLNT